MRACGCCADTAGVGVPRDSAGVRLGAGNEPKSSLLPCKQEIRVLFHSTRSCSSKGLVDRLNSGFNPNYLAEMRQALSNLDVIPPATPSLCVVPLIPSDGICCTETPVIVSEGNYGEIHKLGKCKEPPSYFFFDANVAGYVKKGCISARGKNCEPIVQQLGHLFGNYKPLLFWVRNIVAIFIPKLINFSVSCMTLIFHLRKSCLSRDTPALCRWIISHNPAVLSFLKTIDDRHLKVNTFNKLEEKTIKISQGRFMSIIPNSVLASTYGTYSLIGVLTASLPSDKAYMTKVGGEKTTVIKGPSVNNPNLNMSKNSDQKEKEDTNSEGGDMSNRPYIVRESESSSELSTYSIGDFERYFDEKEVKMEMETTTRNDVEPDRDGYGMGNDEKRSEKDFNNNEEDGLVRGDASGCLSLNDSIKNETTHGTNESESSTCPPLCNPSPLSPPPSAPPMPPTARPAHSKCLRKSGQVGAWYNPAIPRTAEKTLDKIRQGDRSVVIVGSIPDFPQVKKNFDPVFQNVHQEMRSLEEEGDRNEGHPDRSILDFTSEEIQGYWRETTLQDPEEGEIVDKEDKWPEFPGLKDAEMMSSTIEIGKITGNDEEPSVRDNALKSQLRMDKDGVSNLKDSVGSTAVPSPCNDPPKMNNSLDNSINLGIQRLRKYRDEKANEERVRNKQEFLSGKYTRNSKRKTTSRFDPYQHPQGDVDQTRPRHTIPNPVEQTTKGMRQTPMSQASPVKGPALKSTPDKTTNGQVSEPISSWADDDTMTSTFESSVTGGSKRKRKRNKRSRRGKRRDGDDRTTMDMSTVDSADNSSAVRRAIRSMEKSVDRLEKEKAQLQSIASAVEKVSAAEQAAISAGLSPLKLGAESILLDSETEQMCNAPPPTYDDACGGILESLQSKEINPVRNLLVYPVTRQSKSAEEEAEIQTEHSCQVKDIVPKTTLQKISSMLNSDKGLNGTFGALDPNESNVEQYGDGEDYEYQKHQIMQYGESVEDLDKSRDMALKDLMPKQYRSEIGTGKVVRAKAIVQFVVVRRERDSSGEWEFPGKQEFMDLLNKIEHKNSIDRNGVSAALEYNNMWGLVPILGLRIRNLALLDRFRDQIDQYQDGVAEYTTFPKLGLDRKFAITIMLWQDLADFHLDILPRNLLDRNPDLAGGLRINRIKHFKDTDQDVRGNSMKGVRLIQIDTTKEFRDALYFFPRSYRFGLGPSRVVIRGGERIDEEDSRAKGSKNRRRPRQRQSGYEEKRDQAAHNLSQTSVDDLLRQNGGANVDKAAQANMKGNKSSDKEPRSAGAAGARARSGHADRSKDGEN